MLGGRYISPSHKVNVGSTPFWAMQNYKIAGLFWAPLVISLIDAGRLNFDPWSQS
jgi:hypothetical protein